jgi:Ca2+-binding EF-hand superfamily protein
VKDIEAAFNEIDTDGSGRISHPEFIQALRKVGLAKIGDAESYQLMSKYRRPGNNSGEMTLEEFRDCMNDYLKIPTSLDTARPAEKPSQALELAEKAVKNLPKNVDKICDIFKPFDEFKNGELTYDNFRKGLDSAGIKLTNAQLMALCYKLDAMDDGVIAYRDFARYVVGGDVIASGAKGGGSTLDAFKHWVQHGIRPAMDLLTGRPMDKDTAVRRAASKTGLSEVEVRVAHALLGRRQDMRSAFIRYDSSRRGEMTREDVIHMLEALDVPCSKDLIDLLFQKYDLNRNGEL